MKIIKFCYKLFVFVFFTIIILIIALYTNAYLSKPLVLKSDSTYQLYDTNDTIFYTGNNINDWTSIDNINQNLINAVISIEDKNFYNHNGFDYLRILKALFKNIKKGKIVEGASTISQQYIKNAYLTFDKTWKRKYNEALLTLNLETHYSKDKILESYLNTINYGNGQYGITSAAKYYFDKIPSELTIEEAILLSGIPKNPTKYNPLTNYEEAIKRAKTVALSMYNNNYIDYDTYVNLFKTKINFSSSTNENNINTIMYYIDTVIEEIKDVTNLSEEEISSGNYKIYTSLNTDIQNELELQINENLDDGIQAASIIVNPKNGEIMALTGGKNYLESQYNRATKSKRQVGSTMKPFLYYTGLENGMTSSTTFLSQYTTFNIGNNKTYSPKNYANIYPNKEITMAAALAYSDNIYAVKTNLFLGIDKLINTAKRCGIEDELNEVVSLALGTSEISLYNFTQGYTTLASGGYKRKIHTIRKIEDKNGNVIYQYKNSNNLVLNPNYVYILNELLTSTTNSIFIDYNTPTAINIASKLSQKYALKTGTTNTDYLAVGYTPEKLMVIWTGYDDNEEIPISLGSKVKNIWANTIESIETTNTWYSKPENVIGIIKNGITGEIDNDASKDTIFYYLKGSQIT